jgi:D-aminopeptidase
LRIFYERPAAIASGLRNGGTSEIIVVDGHGSWAMIPLLKTHDQFIEFQD